MNIFFIIDFVNKMNTENDMFGFFFFFFLGWAGLCIYVTDTRGANIYSKQI